MFSIWFHSQQLLNPNLVFRKANSKKQFGHETFLGEKMFLVNASSVSQEYISHHPQNVLKHSCKHHFAPGGTVAAICVTLLPHALLLFTRASAFIHTCGRNICRTDLTQKWKTCIKKQREKNERNRKKRVRERMGALLTKASDWSVVNIMITSANISWNFNSFW